MTSQAKSRLSSGSFGAPRGPFSPSESLFNPHRARNDAQQSIRVPRRNHSHRGTYGTPSFDKANVTSDKLPKKPSNQTTKRYLNCSLRRRERPRLNGVMRLKRIPESEGRFSSATIDSRPNRQRARVRFNLKQRFCPPSLAP
jgi:hypothetical protein